MIRILTWPLLILSSLIGATKVPSVARATMTHLLVTTTLVSARRLPDLLLTIVKLIANTIVIFSCVDDLLQTIIMAVYLYGVGNDRLNTIIMSHNLDRAYNTEHRHVMTTRCFREHFVVMACNYQ
jgi:hypothetical protein